MDNNANFDFVQDLSLRKNLVDSIKFLSFLWALRDSKNENSQEIDRTIMLYSASIIEALLLDFCKRKTIQFPEEKYAHEQTISKSFPAHIDDEKFTNGRIILAIKSEKKKPDNVITFENLLEKLGEFLGKRLTRDIYALKDTRNTLHLSKSRKIIEIKETEKSMNNVLKVIQKVSK
ncbi:MAG: hypothetical protein CO060_03120 [Candidatus Yonathbacteria bacterium CG_4_9_14_0_2_um_filter_43_16]|uniref:Uncharacterized protein n=1 Tax=Candidatus Yonathbacteria bacterium CG_4_10_14_0_8_um_filter_43_17 TaxID=1975099 RepID=A0A2M7Q6F1_9BACT|nr:MAG: hypothetical protein COZ48_02025 [Candidatus Yonathbacteria bacterium CG_4_10_14_3_um_filter_43_12]PIY58682.1 MAG: hypothetical protein COY98_00720 [Candidatus Yonathbacteria bacterium CG_4_10_14_0_8_um_filter_43_17]PJC21691.1 MAG: hypothetical protein CO060_03120 [Candidatus Yonathbacteria bacterium CG_4_9_14_0_2_um_filter_43_16]